MSRELRDDERALLDRLTEGDDDIAVALRDQITAARHSRNWSESDQSFDIEIDGAVPVPLADGIYPPSDLPFTLSSGEQGGLMLWIKSGLIDGLEVYWFDEEIPRLPSPDELTPWEGVYRERD